jgi:biopolymer transport protein ExbD
MLAFGTARIRRRPNLTPMIDVVFLLLVFFMLASRFGHEGTITLMGAGQGADYSGPPRLIEFAPGSVALNGITMSPEALLPALTALMAAPDDVVVLRAQGGASLQDLVAITGVLRAAGLTRLVLVE